MAATLTGVLAGTAPRGVGTEARNSGLAGYVYKLLAVLRRNHLETEIPEPPEGIQL